MKKMKILGKVMMLMMTEDSTPEDLFLNITRKRRSLEDFNLWVNFHFIFN